MLERTKRMTVRRNRGKATATARMTATRRVANVQSRCNRREGSTDDEEA